MLLRRFFHPRLAQSSYLIACSMSREAIVIDPHRDVELFLAAARAEGVKITAVTETHVHADFLSGSRDLAAQTGARLYLSGEGRGPWSYTEDFVRSAEAVLLRDGHVIRIGAVRIDAIHTPGHTPEHLTFLVTDTAGAGEPMGAVTGDFVFVGDVGRPDLLERAVHVKGSADGAARQLYHSLARLASYSDYLQLWPGHSAGSACGKGLSAVPHSTLGYERRHNWALRVDDEDRFVVEIMRGQPDAPAYFTDM
jgi:hydroxyacylglutathione hydrolase